jgi:hypothetical protein
MHALEVIDAAGAVRALGKPMTGIVLQDRKGTQLGEFGNPPGIR